MIESIIIYLFTILTTAYAFHVSIKAKTKVQRNIVLLFAMAIPVLTAGIRYGIGEDYFTYINGFEVIRGGAEVRWSELEKGYVYLNLALAELGLEAQSIMFFSSFITMQFILMAFLNKQNNVSAGFGMLAFMCLFYQSSFNIMRMMIAVSIFIYNIGNIEKQNLRKYIIFTILEVSFHVSALATIPLYWLYNNFLFKDNLLRKLLLYVFAVLLIINFNQILDWILIEFNFSDIRYYEQYIGNSDKTIDIALKKAIMYLPILFPGAVMYKRFQQQDENFRIYYSLNIIGTIISVMTTFSVSYVDRISLYFIASSVILIGIYMEVFKKTKNYLGYFGIIFYLFSYWVYVYIINNEHGTFPYKSIFS